MSFCSKCGTSIPEDAKFCPSCGTPVSSTVQVTPIGKTGLDLIGSNKNLQDHWIKRIIAIIIDSVIVYIASWILFMIILIPIVLGGAIFFGWIDWLIFPFYAGIIYVLYFSILESAYGWSLGKKVMGLQVTTLEGRRAGIDKTFIRNISKIYWVLLLLDLLFGLVTIGDPHQKYSDRIAGTTVIQLQI